jgi:hypothetical protein
MSVDRALVVHGAAQSDVAPMARMAIVIAAHIGEVRIN